MEVESLIKSHNLRKMRVGDKWWSFLKDLKGSEISGKEAMFICDSYGIRHSDLIFWMDVIGCKVKMDELVVEINEKEHMKSLMIQCHGYREQMDKC